MEELSTESIERAMKRRTQTPVPEPDPAASLCIPSGASVFNLALSDRIDGGIGAGKVTNIVGDSSSGKTFLGLSIFAEMCQRKEFDGYRLIFDDAESASEFNLTHLFGKVMEGRVEPPALDEDGEPYYSDTIQDFEENLHVALDADVPFLYLLDSFDALTCDEEIDKSAAIRKARSSGKEVKGSYGMDKAKHASRLLRLIVKDIKNTQSAVVILSQTRDNIDLFSPQKSTRAGGRALKFYSAHEVWLAIVKRLKKKDRQIGILVRAKVSKNKYTGKVREATFPIYYDYGVDDMGACVDFLVKEGVWTKAKGTPTIIAPVFNLRGSAAHIIARIEKDGLEDRVRGLVQATWNMIEESLKSDRKRRYQ